MTRNSSLIDLILSHADNALKTLTPGAVKPKTPYHDLFAEESPTLDNNQKRHFSGLMRVNHTGEVCAQALYQGQSLTAKSAEIEQSMREAADEELDHLAWCENRLAELEGRCSYLNPLFYASSYSLGALAGLFGDKISLGFVAATEDQVSLHLKNHLQQMKNADPKSSAIIAQMLEDEQRHAKNALDAGGIPFATPVKKLMTLISKVMTTSAYRI